MFMAVMNLDQNSDCQAGFSEDTCSVLQLQMQKVSPRESGLESKTSTSFPPGNSTSIGCSSAALLL